MLRLLEDTLAVGQTLRLKFTARHSVPEPAPAEIGADPDGAVRDTGVVTLTTTEAHGAAEGDEIVVENVVDASFNGAFEVASADDEITLTYNQAGEDTTSGGGTVEVVQYATIPESDFDGFCHLAASFAFTQLAALKIGSSDPTVAADSVDYRTKSDQYRSMAKAERGLYAEATQRVAEGGALKAASNVKALEVDLSTGGQRLTHPRR